MVRCTFVVASANRELFTDERASMPEPGEQVSYDGREYEIVTVNEQLPSTNDDTLTGDPLTDDSGACALVRVTPADAGAGGS